MLKILAFYLEKQKSFTSKKYFKPLWISKQKALFTDPIFSKGFGTMYEQEGTTYVYCHSRNR